MSDKAHHQLFDRFARHMERTHHAQPGLAEALVRVMDVVIVPPGCVVYDHTAASQDPPSSDLLVVDSGFISVTLPLPQAAYRIGKVSGGAVLGAEAFIAAVGAGGGTPTSPSAPPARPPLPTRAVADTFAQLLRLSARRFEQLEAADPRLACQLLRLLCLVAQQTARQQILGDAASKIFKVNVQPSASLEALLVGQGLLRGPAATAPAAADTRPSASRTTPVGRRGYGISRANRLSRSQDSLQQQMPPSHVISGAHGTTPSLIPSTDPSAARRLRSRFPPSTSAQCLPQAEQANAPRGSSPSAEGASGPARPKGITAGSAAFGNMGARPTTPERADAGSGRPQLPSALSLESFLHLLQPTQAWNVAHASVSPHGDETRTRLEDIPASPSEGLASVWRPELAAPASATAPSIARARFEVERAPLRPSPRHIHSTEVLRGTTISLSGLENESSSSDEERGA